MSRHDPNEPEKSNDVPAWVVSYTDMITLLLAFFVLMMAFASRQDPELFFVGQGSFRRAIAGWGLPNWLLGREFKSDFQHRKVKYSMEEDPEQTNRREPIDAEREEIRRMFSQLQQAIENMVADRQDVPVSLQATDIRFEPGSVALDAKAQAGVAKLAEELRRNLGNRKIQLYVVGLAADESDRQNQWVHSALRAEAVAKRLRKLLAGRIRRDDWEVLSWGDGPGGQWCRDNGIDPQTSSIVVSILESGV